MRLAASRVGEGDALYDEAARPGGLHRGNEVARAFGADAGILRIGRDDPRLIELARQIGELMDDHRGLCGADRRHQRWRVEDIEHGGDHPRPRELACGRGRARRAGALVPGAKQKRHQPPADGASGTREEYSHGHTPLTIVPAHSASKTRVNALMLGTMTTASGIWVPAFAGTTATG